jgi:sigma-B regulation protein RsbQ
LAASDVVERFNVTRSGRPGARAMVFAHGFGCDQHMWRLMTPAFEDRFDVITFDLAGSRSNPGSYDPERHASLEGYADDLVDLLEGLELVDVVFVGHSVSAMVGVLAARRAPERFGQLVLVGPSARYINDGPYVGGFDAVDIEELLESLASNYLGWSSAMAPVIMANADRPELGDELTESFCATDPAIAREFARVTFTSDNRRDLAHVSTPTLVLQCSDDVIAPVSVGRYVADTMPAATFVLLEATGHCPHLSAPGATIEAIARFVDA